jgi:8-oxo-dGTP pyrophosphatase MutT (NUDIX family)
MPVEPAAALTEAEIARRLGAAPPDPELAALAAAYAGLRLAAVLIPLLQVDSDWHVLLTRRTDTVQSHKGQVSFPGGAAEPEDDSPEATALREAHEEIGLRPADARILGRLAVRPTISSYLVTPVVARIPWPYPLRLSPAEVSRAFHVPLAWLAQAAHREERPHTAPGGIFDRVIFYQAFEGEVLWGASARITLDLLHALGLVE